MKRNVSKPLQAVKWIARIWGSFTSIAYVIAYIYIRISYSELPQSFFNLVTVGITIISLGLAWRWELLGGSLAIITGLTRILVDFNQSMYRYSIAEYWNQSQTLLLGWLMLFIAPAILFVTFWLLSRIKGKKQRRIF